MTPSNFPAGRWTERMSPPQIGVWATDHAEAFGLEAAAQQIDARGKMERG